MRISSKIKEKPNKRHRTKSPLSDIINTKHFFPAAGVFLLVVSRRANVSLLLGSLIQVSGRLASRELGSLSFASHFTLLIVIRRTLLAVLSLNAYLRCVEAYRSSSYEGLGGSGHCGEPYQQRKPSLLLLGSYQILFKLRNTPNQWMISFANVVAVKFIMR